MIAALEGSEWSAARPGRTLPTGKTRYPFYRKLGEPHDRSGRAENLVPTGIRSRMRPVRSQSLYRLNYRAHSAKYYASNCPKETQENRGTFIASRDNFYIYYELNVICKVYKVDLSVLCSQIPAHVSYFMEMVSWL